MSDFEARSADFLEQRLRDINAIALSPGRPEAVLAQVRELSSPEALHAIRQRALGSSNSSE